MDIAELNEHVSELVSGMLFTSSTIWATSSQGATGQAFNVGAQIPAM
jgi:hypothetical protein